jgi:hypothetical protein
LGGTLLALILFVSATFAGAALAAPAMDDAEQDLGSITATDVTFSEGLGQRGDRPIRGNVCRALAARVAKECPCEGPDEAGWGGHEDYMECARRVVGEAVDAHEKLAECGEKLLERLDASEIGEPDFECPELRARPVPPKRLPRLVPIVRCARMIMAVHEACPCEGPDGDGWGEDGHEAFVECVKDKVKELVEAGGPEKCAKLIVARAEKSKIGEPGFECPQPREPRQPGEPGEPRPRP